ncbi:MAG: thiamine biosynthesis protein ThiS [Phycisphaerales bacterium]|jgi:thiamine biosynthesis protein ThiS
MTLTVNGESHDLPDGLTVEGLLTHLGLSQAVCAAEVNKALVPRSERPDRVLSPGDAVEVVTLVGGG